MAAIRRMRVAVGVCRMALFSSGVIVNNISCLGVLFKNLLTWASLLFAPSGWGLVGFFLYVIFGCASSGDAAFFGGVVCFGLSFC